MSPSPTDPVFSRVTPGEILKLRYAGDVDGLLRMLQTPEAARSANVRREIVFVFYKLGDSAAAPELRRLATSDPDGTVRAAAASALVSLGDPAALTPLRRAVGATWRPWVKLQLWLSLREFEQRHSGY
jgi:hypothetical protein